MQECANHLEEYQKKISEYTRFMYNPANSHNCGECPENRGETWPETILPCGQQNCWVDCHRREDGDEEC